MKIIAKTLLVAPLLLSLGCSFYARSPEDYKKVTRELVDTQSGSIKECYDVSLQTNETVSGTVVVNFTVEKKTGRILNPTVDAKSTAPAELSKCVVDAISNLQLDPADARDGIATFVWELKPGAPAEG
ncbi:MAG: AgmX/PglI C-terminal domain-containing protein [Myxococcales bacterium]|nr:AgmX/PglI C-terminal domain-containing protein [Myxococcales bacterium]